MADMSKINFNIDGVNNEFDIKDKVARNDNALMNTTWGGVLNKNLLNITATSTTVSGVTIEVTRNNGIKLNGTATQSTYFHLYGNGSTIVKKFPKGSYIATSGNSTHSIFIKYGTDITGDNGTQINVKDIDTPFTINNDSSYLAVFINITAGTTYNNTIIYPMIRYADITSNEYTQYKTNLANHVGYNTTTLGTQCKNIFDYDTWITSAWVNKGTKELVNNGIKVTVDSDKTDAYTAPYESTASALYKMPVRPNTEYIISWVSDSDTAGDVYVFFNGSSNASDLYYNNNRDVKSFRFITKSNTTFITIRVGVTGAGNSITYSNIMIREASITDDTYEPYKPSIDTRLTTLENGIQTYKNSIGITQSVTKYIKLKLNTSFLSTCIITAQSSLKTHYFTFIIRHYGTGTVERCQITQLNGGTKCDKYIDGSNVYIRIPATPSASSSSLTWDIAVHSLIGSLPEVTFEDDKAGTSIENTLPPELEERIAALEAAQTTTTTE